MPCTHCENPSACESVCQLFAAAHYQDGRDLKHAPAPSCNACRHSDTPAAVGRAKHPCTDCKPVNTHGVALPDGSQK